MKPLKLVYIIIFANVDGEVYSHCLIHMSSKNAKINHSIIFYLCTIDFC